MESSYLESKTFGIGQLITQRKLFRVPEHQRNFSWEKWNVEQLFEDITSSLEDGAPDYFVGLIVLLGPHENVWQILDGQQRLATVTMFYSAIRFWLNSRDGFAGDAEQIESEFIAVRQLGGAFVPRLTLNIENQGVFLDTVVLKRPDEELEKRYEDAPKKSSNALLIDAAITCRTIVNQYAKTKGSESGEKQAKVLFDLANYIEERVKVVAMDVATDTNAFMIFEALNARGNELSVLDLVKNHIFGHAAKGSLVEIRARWSEMSERIEDKNADDFLKIFWTSRFGRIQKAQLYSRIKKLFSGEEGALQLANDLSRTSEAYVSLDDPQHEIWEEYGPDCQGKIETLTMLGSRQVRAPILSAIGLFNQELMSEFLRMLIVIIVRYQIVGKRRTGPLEIACARLATEIFQKKLHTADDLRKSTISLTPSDEEFLSDFKRFSEKNSTRAAYFLSQLEVVFRAESDPAQENPSEVAYHPSDLVVDFIFPRVPVGKWIEATRIDPDVITDRLYWLGNRCLLEVPLHKSSQGRSFREACDYYTKSNWLLTSRAVPLGDNWARKEIENRQEVLSKLALKAWSLTPSATE
jgi:Protein of unknown function DUF262/Protein of unknown function (DUF1524)